MTTQADSKELIAKVRAFGGYARSFMTRQDYADLEAIKALADLAEQQAETIAREQRMVENARRDAAALSEYVALARPVIEAMRAAAVLREDWQIAPVGDKRPLLARLILAELEIERMPLPEAPKETP